MKSWEALRSNSKGQKRIREVGCHRSQGRVQKLEKEYPTVQNDTEKLRKEALKCSMVWLQRDSGDPD
jgi:hypothetical protein